MTEKETSAMQRMMDALKKLTPEELHMALVYTQGLLDRRTLLTDKTD